MKSPLFLLTEIRGIQASGKTTTARILIHNALAPVARVNKDDLRQMMFGNSYQPKNEAIVIAAERAVAAVCANHRYSVIVDDTNLSGDARWRIFADEMGMEYTGMIMNTPVEQAIVRDAIRDKSVGPMVIKAAAGKLVK